MGTYSSWMQFSRRDFDRFLFGSSVNHHCSHCAETKWVVNLGAGDNAGPAEFHLTPEGGGGYHAFVSISCANCGRADFFHERQIREWLGRNPEPTGD